MPYATPLDLFKRKDVNIVNDMVSDDTERQDRVSLQSHPFVLEALETAEGLVNASLLKGGRYTAEDLEGLTGPAQALLQQMVCDIAMYHLYERRPYLRADETAKQREVAQQYLDDISNGELVFGIPANLEATLPTIDGPTSHDYQRMNLIPDRCPRYYPARITRLPLDRG